MRTIQRNGRLRRVDCWAARTGKPLVIGYPVFRGTRDERLVETMQGRLTQFDLLLGGIGSMFLLDCGQGPFLVTAGHVYTAYLAERRVARRIICQIGDLEFHPEERLIELQEGPDIATFRVADHEIKAIGKKIVTHAAGTWPPEPLPEGYAVLVSGFPGHERRVHLRENLTPREINFGYYYANTPITVSVPNQISCRFERWYWVNSFPEGLPEPGFDLGGLSGAPLLRPVYSQSRRTWIVQLAGVITQAHSNKDWEQVTAATTAHIRPDGRIVHQVL